MFKKFDKQLDMTLTMTFIKGRALKILVILKTLNVLKILKDLKA